MLRRRPRLPITEEQHAWIDSSLIRLDALLGSGRILAVRVVLPTDEFFPDTFQPTLAAARLIANRVAGYMGVNMDSFEIHVFAEGEASWKELVPSFNGETRDAGGLFFSKPEGSRFTVGIHSDKLKDPLALIATIAHELAHVILLGGSLIERDEPEMEPLTDLATVVLGFGVFNSSAAFLFKQWTEGQRQGWRTSRAGYLSEESWGYALAKFAQIRGEAKPEWRRVLAKNVQVYFDQSSRWLREKTDG